MYEDKTPEAIKAEILAAIRQSQGLSAMAGGFADGVAGPVAEQLSEAYRALEGVPSMLFVDESSGGYIDLVGGQYYSITRREGTRAYCDISFSGTPGLVLPQGTAFLTAGGLAYSLLAAVTLGEDGAGEGRLEAAEAGSAYNVEAGAIDRMYVNLTGLSTTRSTAETFSPSRATPPCSPASGSGYSGPPPAATATSTASGPWRSRGWETPRWWSCPAGQGRWGSRWWTATTGPPRRELWRPWRPTLRRSGPSARR